MREYEILSRSQLYESSDEAFSADDETTFVPELEFVEVAVDQVARGEEDDLQLNENNSEDEFAFPLFAQGRTSGETMKVTLREEQEDVIVNERPESYYRYFSSEESRKEFEKAAFTFEDILASCSYPTPDTHPWRVVDIGEYNEKVDNARAKQKSKRPGQRKRQHAKECRERRKERQKRAKLLHQEEMKAKYRGKKPGRKFDRSKKSSRGRIELLAKPKFRTE